jgi:hypothetical protein
MPVFTRSQRANELQMLQSVLLQSVPTVIEIPVEIPVIPVIPEIPVIPRRRFMSMLSSRISTIPGHPLYRPFGRG